MSIPAVDIRGLSKTYAGRVVALAPCDLRVEPGQVFALLGPNGAGKSTLIKLLLSIVRPSSGHATLFGMDIRDPVARRGVGYLPEGHRFPPWLSGRALCYELGRLAGLEQDLLAREVEAKIALVGMSEFAERKVGAYSKGMAQRIGLAQALLGDPRLLFLDEPTDGVDPVGRKDIRDLIRARAAQGCTIFLNSHLLSEVEQLCDHVAILDRGRLLRAGPMREVIESLRGTAHVVEFRTSPLDEAGWQMLADLAPVRMGTEGFSVVIKDRREISLVIDRLRAAGIEVWGVHQRDSGLEEAFIAALAERPA